MKAADDKKLQDDARALAREHGSLRRAHRRVRRLLEPTFLHDLVMTREKLGAAAPGGRHPKATEWFLDNYYLTCRAVRQVNEELPRGFLAKLPQLTTSRPPERSRIESTSEAIVMGAGLELDLVALRTFVDAYQGISTLTIAELWALPTVLRAVVLRHLRRFLDELMTTGRARPPDPPSPMPPGEGKAVDLEPEVGVERCIRALRVLDVVDWKLFFESTNRVEELLRGDPAAVYQRMEFATCDAYRKVVESIAWSTLCAEPEVAELAVALASAHPPGERAGHVGYYLVDTGREELERRLGYQAVGLERVRRAVTGSPTLSYLLPVGVLTWVPLLVLALYVAQPVHPGAVAIAVAALVASIPLSAASVAVVTLILAQLLPPRTLPKMNFDKGLPGDARTLVVMPTLLGRTEDVAAMLRRIELHYLANPDPQLHFALLTDDIDARSKDLRPQASALLEEVSDGIVALNSTHGSASHAPFHLLHRAARWNPAEERFMGWERKRGKLDELNRLLRGDKNTSYSRHVGDPAGLLRIRFVITLDGDTELPMGAAQRLIGALAHPLNRPVFDSATGGVTAGYTIAQPRIETSPSSARDTVFSRAFAGRVGFDIYTHACSELYQDLFGSGIYVGKGIYEVDGFMRSVDGRAPENALVSHDLFEGIHGRTALLTDVVLFETFPSNYATFALRMHRWVRGDWQLFPWLFSRVPSERGHTVGNRLARIDRWKILDNLRRSLTSPFQVVLFVLAWTWLPGSPCLWSLGALAIFVAPVAPALVGNHSQRLETLRRCGLTLAFLLHEASVVLDAVARVFIRTVVTRKHLLQWTSDEHTSFGVAVRSSRGMYWRTMAVSPVLAVAIALALGAWHPSGLLAAAPLLAAWFTAPELARWAGHRSPARKQVITDRERKTLRMLARRTWRFFDTFVGPSDQWLPIDNHQEEPHEQTAHRTSPTNIGLALLATLAAYDFGYIGVSELVLYVRRSFDSISRLQHYRGHLFNWYDTRNLEPLAPRYVSTVDSGNLAGCLLALKQGCHDVERAPVVRREAWDGVLDSLDLLEEALGVLSTDEVADLRRVISRMREMAQQAGEDLQTTPATLRVLCDKCLSDLERETLALLETGAHRHDVDVLRELRTCIDALGHQLRQMDRELATLLPWLSLATEAATFGMVLPVQLAVVAIPDASKTLQRELDTKVTARRQAGALSTLLADSAQRLSDAFLGAERQASARLTDLRALASEAQAEVREMDFTLLYDAQRRLFHIGYNATGDQIDAHYYDLLASEARLASYIAIVKKDVPQTHWYALGRPLTQVDGVPLLLSWGGTMFEYLMPGLLMSSQDGTLLERTSTLAVAGQIAYGQANREPWGVSESAYARLDPDETYQYRSFGVPGLGLKRGLEGDRVVTPYASLLALSLAPRAVVDNVVAFESMGMLGTYGLFEAIDFTPARALQHPPQDQAYAVVRSYMAHHQGMLLIAVGNFLNRRSMVQRFHADAWVASGLPLLNESSPEAGREAPLAIDGSPLTMLDTPAALPPAPAPWAVTTTTSPQAFVLGNGSLSSLLTGSGGGGLRWNGLDLTRYDPDPTSDADGLWFYVRDEETRQVWRATSIDGRTTYAMHKAEFHLRENGISTHVDVAVAAADDVEVRKITLHNESDRPRHLTVTSAGRPVLFDAKQAPTHPAFSSLFVESEFVEELDGLLFARRSQSPDEEPAVVVHTIVREAREVSFAGFESDRSAFLGRCSPNGLPAALLAQAEFTEGRVGAVLDPVMSLTARVVLPANGSASFAFVTTVARSRHVALSLARKYGSMHAVRWAFRDAEQESPRRLQRTVVEAELVPTIQRLFSAGLFDDPAFRVSAEKRATTPPCQRRLWGLGLSGDEPIVVVRVNDPSARILRETLASQRYLRACGVRFDVALVDEHASGYAAEGTESLQSVLAQCGTDEWRSRHGGVFVIRADQISADDLLHLEACARIMLDTRDASLATRLAVTADGPPNLPRFEPSVYEEVESRSPSPLERAFHNGVGGFAASGDEYVIDVGPGKRTPAPWCNVLANPSFGCLVSESGLGASWSLNSGENRLTPWRNDPVLDVPSEVLYLRDEETAAVWSPTPLPAGLCAETRIRHGAGYTTYESETHGLVQVLTVFVPCGASLKVARLRLKNTLNRPRRLTATYYAEWVLGSRRKRQAPYIVSEFDSDNACLLATCDWSAEFAGRVAFVASQATVHGVTADRTEFLGRRGDYARPEALERWGLSGRVDTGADPCAALQVHLDIAAGEAVETHFILGQASSRHEALELVARFREASAVDEAWTALHAYWNDLLGSIRVKTPEPSMDLMLNRWLLYQTLSSRVFGRTGFYQSSGAFGFRDQLQDVLALLHAAPSLAREHILCAAKHQFEEGDVLHWWHPPSGRGVRTRCSDDMAWLPYVTGEYVAATGDWSILDEPVTFLTGEILHAEEHNRYARYDASPSSEPLLEHCRRALVRAVTAGAHGLPLMGDGDWNDGMSRVGAKGLGESVWLGWFLCATMDRFAALTRDDGAASRWCTQADVLRGTLSEVGWDGGWYLRAFHDDGSLVGSATSRECKIDSIAQSWAVLSQRSSAPHDDQARAAVRAADSELIRESDRLALLFWPPFDNALHDPGYIGGYPPGVRENGGQYTHAAAWLGFAHVALGDGARAEGLFRLLNPILHAATGEAVDRYRVEPYVLSGDVYSCAPWIGRGGWSWYTGSAAWVWRLGVSEILGLRKEGGTLHIDPCIPPSWPGFEAWVREGKQTLHVVVENPEHVARGIAMITLDGASLDTGRIQTNAGTSGTLEVHVRLGPKAPANAEAAA